MWNEFRNGEIQNKKPPCRRDEKPFPVISESFIPLSQNQTFLKQECIPVGCVPPARKRMGVSLRETPRTETPWTETLLDRDPSGQRAPPL